MKGIRVLLRENLLGFSLVLIGVMCLALSGVFYFAERTYPQSVAAVGSSSPRLSEAQIEILEAQNRAFASIAEAVTPAVVNVGARKAVRVQESPFASDPFFRRFFGDIFGVPRQQVQRSLGSGVLVSPEGYIVTNNHVIARADEIKVLLADRREFPAELIGTDEATEVAVIKVDAKDLPFIRWGDSTKLKVGDTVMAFGNPFGLNFTVTRGIVSAVGRAGLGIAQYGDFIQTDAAINVGNSGGALVNVRGELVGINTAIYSPNQGGFSGVGFAIPSAMARSVYDSLVATGRVVRGFLGVSVVDLTPTLAKQFNAPSLEGVLVSSISSSAPAAKSNLRRGDVILEINGMPIRSADQWRAVVASTAPETKVRLKILRDGKPAGLPVTVGEQPSSQAGRSSGRGSGDGARGRNVLRGVEVMELTPEILNQLHLPAELEGVVVTRVGRRSPAGWAGLGRGDVILEVNRRAVRSLQDFERLTVNLEEEAAILLINRQGFTFFMTISMGR